MTSGPTDFLTSPTKSLWFRLDVPERIGTRLGRAIMALHTAVRRRNNYLFCFWNKNRCMQVFLLERGNSHQGLGSSADETLSTAGAYRRKMGLKSRTLEGD